MTASDACQGSLSRPLTIVLLVEEFTVRAGALPAGAILKQATINPAKMLRQEGKLGVIAPGAIADLLILKRNPLKDIKVLDRPELYLQAVIQEGRLVTGTF